MQLRRFLGNIARVYLAIGALAVSAVAGAEELPFYPPQGYPQCDCCGSAQCCPPPPGCPQTCSWGSPCGGPPVCNWGYNPPGYLTCDNCVCNDGFLDSLTGRVDFLWWRANEECLALGSEERVGEFGNPAVEGFNESREKRPSFKYDPGFRLGLSHHCPCDCWDIAVNWTHFHTKARASGASNLPPPPSDVIDVNNVVVEEADQSMALARQVATENDFTIFAPFWERVAGQVPDYGRGRWTLDLDLIDLELGYKYYVCHCFTLRPHIGLRGARIDQRFRAFYEANSTAEFANVIAPPNNTFATFSKSKCDFLAVGPRIGLDADIHFGCGFAIFGQAAASLVFGRFDNHSSEFHEDLSRVVAGTGDAYEFEYFAHNPKTRTSRTITDLIIGVKWEHCFEWCNRSHPVSLAFAWEHHAFFDMNNFNFGRNGFPSLTSPLGTDISDGATHDSYKFGDLYTQGLTVSLEVGF